MTVSPALFTELLILAALTALNGLFAVAEMSLVSANRTNLDKLPDETESGESNSLNLSERPSDLLSTVQIGMTLLTLAAGLYSGLHFVEPLQSVLSNFDISRTAGTWLARGAIFVSVSAFIVIFGDLLPRRIAHYAASSRPLHAARPVLLFARVFEPVVRLMVRITDIFCLVFGLGETQLKTQVSTEEIKSFLQESAKTGAFDATEQRMVQGVIEFSEARISSFMTPRPEVIWLDIDDPAEKNRKKIIDARHSHFPVVKGSLDNVVGVIHVKDILSRQLLGQPFDLTLCLEQALYLPESADASRSVDLFRNSATHFAFVVNEYGNVQGVLTLTDILRAIVGDFADTMDDKSTTILKRQDGSWIVDGLVTVEELREKLLLRKLRGEDSGNFHTVAGFVLSELGKIPKTGDSFECDGIRYEVIDMDGNRVDKVLIHVHSSPNG